MESTCSLDSIMIKADALVTSLVMGSPDVIKETVHMLRILSKIDDDYRACIGDAGAIPHLLRSLSSSDPVVQENSITCLLNISIAPTNKERIMGTRGAIDKIVEALRTGANLETRQNAAATLFSILMVEEYRDAIGQKPSVIPALLDLLQDSSPMSRKDALKALFHLSLCHQNRSRIVKAGTLDILLNMIEHRVRRQNRSQKRKVDTSAEDALALLGQLGACPEGVSALKDPKIIAMLVELLEPGESSRIREQAAAALLMLCQTGKDLIVQEVLKHDVCVSALCGLLSAGSPRAKSKAGSLMQILMVNEETEILEWVVTTIL